MWCETECGGSYNDSLYFNPHANTHIPNSTRPKASTRIPLFPESVPTEDRGELEGVENKSYNTSYYDR